MTSSGSPQSLLASGFPELISVVVRWYLRQGLDPPAPRSRSALDRSGRTGAGPGGGPRQRRAGGYRRIHGEVAVLAHKIAPSTVWQIKDAGIDPAPERSAQTWRAFPEAPAKTILAAGFHAGAVLLGRLHVLLFIEHGTRQASEPVSRATGLAGGMSSL